VDCGRAVTVGTSSAQCRAMQPAEMTHEEARTIMRRIANDYDRLAKFAEEQLAAQEKQND
jgi:hypothetical protein